MPIKAVSEMLRHADVATTMRIYSHVQPDVQATALAALDLVTTAHYALTG